MIQANLSKPFVPYTSWIQLSLFLLLMCSGIWMADDVPQKNLKSDDEVSSKDIICFVILVIDYMIIKRYAFDQ